MTEPHIPTAAMTSIVSDELSRLLTSFQITSVRPAARESWPGTVEAIRNALDNDVGPEEPE